MININSEMFSENYLLEIPWAHQTCSRSVWKSRLVITLFPALFLTCIDMEH